METTLLATLVADVRSQTDTQTTTPTNDHITTAEITRWLQQAYREMIDVILAAGGDDAIDLLAVSTTLTSPFTLPDNFYRLISVDASVDGFDRQLRRQAWRTRHNRSAAAGSVPMYRLIGQQVTFFPSGSAPAAIVVWYVGNLPDDDHDTALTTFNGWDEFLIAHAAIKVCAKEERDPGLFIAQLTNATARIQGAAKLLALANTETIISVAVYPADYDA